MPPSQSFDQAVVTSRIIVAALIMGLLVFSGISFVMRPGQPDPGMAFMIWVSAGFAGLAIPTSFVVPTVLANGFRRSLPPYPNENVSRDSFAQPFVTKTIIGAAILEGAAFFAIVSSIIAGQVMALVIVAFCLLGIAAKFPLLDQPNSWVESQLSQWERGE